MVDRLETPPIEQESSREKAINFFKQKVLPVLIESGAYQPNPGDEELIDIFFQEASEVSLISHQKRFPSKPYGIRISYFKEGDPMTDTKNEVSFNIFTDDNQKPKVSGQIFTSSPNITTWRHITRITGLHIKMSDLTRKPMLFLIAENEAEEKGLDVTLSYNGGLVHQESNRIVRANPPLSS